MPDLAEAPVETLAEAPAQEAAPQQPGVLPEWGQVSQRFTAAYPSVPPEEIQRTYEGVRNVSLWRARLANSEETTGSWLYRRAIPVASAQLNIRNAGYVDKAREKILNGQGTPQDAEVIAVQNRLAESDANASPGQRLMGGLASIPAVVGEAYLGGRLLRPVMGLFGGAAATGTALTTGAASEAAPAATSLASSVASRFAQGAATAPLMPNLYAERAIQNNREAGRAGADWRGFPAAVSLAAIQNGVFSSVSNLGGSAPTGPGALDTTRRLFAQTVGAMAVQQGMDIGTSALDDAAKEVFGTSLNLTTRYGVVGELWRNRDKGLQEGLSQAITMAAFAALHEIGNRPPSGPTRYSLAGRELPPENLPPGPGIGPSGPEPVQWLGGEPRAPRQIMDATRSFLDRMDGQGRTGAEAGSEMQRVMDVVQRLVANPTERGMTRDAARQQVVDTFPPGPARDYGLRVVQLVPFPEAGRSTGRFPLQETSPGVYGEQSVAQSDTQGRRLAGPPASPNAPEAPSAALAPQIDPGAPQAPPVAASGFTTARGSTYTVNADGTTTRNAVPKVGTSAGAQRPSERTIYVPNDAATRLTGGGIVIKNGVALKGRVGLDGKFVAKHQVTFSEQPAVGMSPVELYGARNGGFMQSHVGSPITALGHGEPAHGMSRIYRVETRPEHVKQPAEWIRQGQAESGHSAAQGRWFTADPADVAWYQKDHGDTSHVVYVDVPTKDLDKYRVSNSTERIGSGRDVKSFSKRADAEFFLPRELADMKRPTMPPPVTKPSLAERALGKGRAAAAQATVQAAPPTAPRVLREVREAPLAKATSTADVRRVLQEAPGFQSPAEMFQAHNIPPVQQAVLQARFSEAHPSFLQIAQDLRPQFASPRTGKAYTRAAIKAMEKSALSKLGLHESVHEAVSMGNRDALVERSTDQGDEIVDAVIHGEISASAAESRIQDEADKLQVLKDRIADETVRLVNDAKTAGATQNQIDEIMADYERKVKDASQSATREARQPFESGRRRPGSLGPAAKPTPVPQGSRQSAQQTSAQPQTSGLPQNGGAGVPLVQPSAVPGVAKASAAGPVEPPLTNKQRFAVERSKPAAGEYLAANFAREILQAKTLFNAIVAQGSLNEANVRSYGLDLKTLKESFPSRLFVKKGGVNIEDLVGGSEIGRQIWGTRAESETDKQHRGDELMEKLANHFLLEPGNWYEHEDAKAHFEALKEDVYEQARKTGLTGEALETSANAEIAKCLAGIDQVSQETGGNSEGAGEPDEWSPRHVGYGSPVTRQPDVAPTGDSPASIADFVREWHGDESGHVDPEVLREFAIQYGVKPATNAISHLNTVWRQLAGEGSPRTTDVSPRLGEALERFNGSEIYARFAAPVLAEKVLGADQSSEFDRRLGAAMVERRLRWERKVYGDQALAASADLQKAMLDRDAAEQDQKQAEQQARQYRSQEMPKQADIQDAYARTFAKARAEAQAVASEASTRSAEAIKARNGVVTLIGMPDSPFQTMADYVAAHRDPAIAAAIKRHEQFAVPVMNDAFRRSKGMNPTDPINSPTQIPGSPINLKSARAGDKDTESVIWTKGGSGSNEAGASAPQRAGRPPNAKLRRNKYTKQAFGDSEGYDISYAKMLEASLVHQLVNAAKAEAVRTGVEVGKYKWGKPGQSVSFDGEETRWGQEFNDVKPPKGTQADLAGETSLYVHPDLAHEFRRSIDIDEPIKFKTIEKFMGAIMAVNLASTAELTYHAKNQLGFLIRTGFNPASIFRDIVGVVKRDPKIMDQLVELARINTMKSEGFETSNISGKGKYNPLAWGAKLLDLTRKVLLLQGNAAYDRMVAKGLTHGSETGRRNFLNQLGNYNRRSQHKFIKFLRDTQIGPFATAGFNYLVQGVRSVVMNPGVKPASMEARIRLRAGMLLRTVAVLAAVELINKALWGRMDASDDTPLGAVRVGTSAANRAQYIDIMDLIGLKRGLRVLGLLALIEGKRKNAPQEKIEEKAARDMMTALVHPLAGPGAQFGLIAAFGVDASDFHVAQHASTLKHESQPRLNVQAALEHANPLYATLFGHSQKEKPASQRVMELAGPFGVKTAPPPRLR